MAALLAALMAALLAIRMVIRMASELTLIPMVVMAADIRPNIRATPHKATLSSLTDSPATARPHRKVLLRL